MSFGLLNVAMLAGLAGVAIPLVIHLISRRRDPIVDWGAMQFLELGAWQRRRLDLSDLLLLLARMGLLAFVALALARPFWSPARGSIAGLGGAGRRDVVLVVDGSSSMSRESGGATALARATAWAKGVVGGLSPGDSVAVLVAKDRVRPLVDPPSFDFAAVGSALSGPLKPGGASDLAGAVGEAFRVLERTNNPNREVIVLSDDQRSAWRPGDDARWALLRELRGRMPVAPRLWAVSFAGTGEDLSKGANGSIGPLKLPRGAIVPGRPLAVTADLTNAGPGPLTRSVEMLIDGKPEPGSGQVIGPVPAGGRAALNFRARLETPGDHLITLKLGPGDDPIPGDDESSRAVSVAQALNVLLVDGEPSSEPLGGEVAFLRAALAPNGDDTRVVATRVVEARNLTPESLKGQRVIVLANVDRLNGAVASAVEAFLNAGGGVLIAPGDRTDAGWWNDAAWMPAKLGDLKGAPGGKSAVAHPSPASFTGPALAPLGAGDSPTLASAEFFSYRVLIPNKDGAALARLDTGDPWIVERPVGRGKAIAMAAPIDAEGGTLPVNPDFVPLMHELVSGLAEGGESNATLRPGEPLTFPLPASLPANITTLPLHTPDGRTLPLPILRDGPSPVVRHLDTSEPGVYRLDLPANALYAVVESDPRESDPEPLTRPEADRLSEGWPLAFEPDPALAADRILSAESNRRTEVWRLLIFAALAGLCAEVWLTRRTARARGIS